MYACSRPFTVLGDERRDQRVERTLPRRDRVRQARREREPRAAVVQREAGARHHDPRPEVVVDRVDERHHVPVGVGDREVDRLALRPERARIHALLRARRIHATASLGDELVGQHLLGGHVEMVRVADEPIEVGIGELLRLDEVMQVRRRVVPHRLEVVRLEDAQHLERRDALVVRRQLPHAVAAERHRDRRHPVGCVLLQVVERDEAVERRQSRDDALARARRRRTCRRRLSAISCSVRA